MRVVIPGGSGFIGSALTACLVEKGHTVRIPSRNPETLTDRQTDAVKYVRWDGKNPDQLAELLHDADAVVSLLGENIASGRWTEARKQRIVDSRLQAGAALVDAFAKLDSDPRVLIQASAVGYYGSWPNMSQAPVCTEKSPNGSNFLADTAARWEESTKPLESLLQVRRCVIRTAPVLGPNGGMLQNLLPIFRLGLGGPAGSGRQPFCWIHLHDEAEAIAFLLENAACAGVYNLVAPETITAETFARTLGQALHRPALLRAPAFALRLAMGDLADELLLAGQRVFPQRLLEAGFKFTYPALQEALKASL